MRRAVVILATLGLSIIPTGLHAGSDCFCGEDENGFFYTTGVPSYEEWLMLYPWEVLETSPIYDLRSPYEDDVVGCRVVVGLVDETITLNETLTTEEYQQIYYGGWMSQAEFEERLLESQCLPSMS